MAVAFIATASAGPGNVTGITVTIPATVANGDQLIFALVALGTATFTQPTQAPTLLGSAAGTTRTMYVYRRTAASDASTTFTWTANTANRMTLVVVAYRGARCSSTTT